MKPASFHAFIPVKALTSAKTRLAGTLSSGERAELTLWMLSRVLANVSNTRRVDQISVVTSDPIVGARATSFGADVVTGKTDELNAALSDAVRHARSDNSVIVQADLPWISSHTLDALLRSVTTFRADAVIAADQWGTGTSALAWRAAAGFSTFAFGPGSFGAHFKLARAAGLRCRANVPHVEFSDVDTIGDLRKLQSDFPDLLRVTKVAS